MKKKCLVILFGLFLQHANADPNDSTLLKRADTVLKRTDTVNRKVDSLILKANTIKDSITAISKKIASSSCQKCKDDPVTGFWQWLLVFLPAIIFLILFIVVLRNGLNKFQLDKALAENDYPRITQINPEYKAANITPLIFPLPGVNPPAPMPDIATLYPPTIEVSNTAGAAPSTSRYIAFIASLLTLVVALCMSCFFIYYYIRTGCAPDLSALSAVLIALGIGVAPYAFNKISAAIAAKKEE